MKKISLMFLAVFTLSLGVFLAACNFKTPILSFSEDVVMISLGEEINLDDLATAKDIDKSDVEYKFSSTSFFEREGNVLKATSYGQTMVYATYDGNSLDSFLFVVKKPFEQVANIQMDDFGLVTWNAVVDKFDETEDFVTASNYTLNIHYINEDESEQNDYVVTANTNSYQLLENGKYTLEIYAEAEGKFDRSPVATTTVYFGYMPELKYDDFTFELETGDMTWNEVSNATYSVTFNGENVLEKSEKNTVNLTPALAGVSSGSYIFTVTVHDKDGIKISKVSEEISIVKLSAPLLENAFDEENGGRMKITMAENALKAMAFVSDKSFEFENAENYSTFEGIDAGENLVRVQSLAVTSKRDGVFYVNSDIVDGASIYKLASLSLIGRGDNLENADTFNITATSSSVVTDTAFKTVLNKADETFENLDTNGLTTSASSIDKEIALSGAGNYTLVAYNYAKSQSITLDKELYLINSNASNSLEFIKLDTLPSVSHQYTDGVSSITFTLADEAENYLLEVLNGDEYESVNEELYSYDAGTFTFTDEIESLFIDSYFIDGTITFKIIAEREDKTLSISSATLKTLTRLSAPTSDSGDSGETEYVWSAVEGAENYTVSYAYIAKEAYDEGVSSVDAFDNTITIGETSTTLEAGHYYYIEIFASPLNEDENLNSFVFKDVFYISKQLATPVINFGLDESKATGDLVEATGYYLEVNNVENMAGITVTLDGAPVTYNYAGDGKTLFLFIDEFLNTSGSVIEVVASSEDSTLFPDSTPYRLTVVRLDASYSSIRNNVVIDEFTSTFTLRHGLVGVSEIVIKENDLNFGTGSADKDAVLNISNITNSEITINLAGSTFDDENKLYETTLNEEGNFIYLESETATYSLQRLNAPTEFAYYDGNFTFTTNETFGEYFVLDMRVQDVNGQNILLKIDLNGERTPVRLAIYDADTKEVLLNKVSFEEGDVLSSSSNNYTINYENLLTILKTNAIFNSYYTQATEIKFSLYNYRNYYMSGVFTLSSLNASCLDGGTELIVKKMPIPVVSFDKTSNMLVWTLNEDNYGHLQNTTYEVYGYNGEEGARELLSTVNTKQYDVRLSTFALSTDYKYDVVAKNPYYLESSSSSVVTIHVLSPIEKVQLSDNSLLLSPNALDAGYISSVQFEVDAGGAQNTSDKKENSFLLTNLEEGSYAFSYVGTDEFEAQGRYYINSSVTTFTLSSISSIAPVDTTVEYSGNMITFDALKESLQSLKYMIVFKDSAGNIASVTTLTNSYAVSPDGEPFVNLNSGTITIDVYAILSSYSVSAGGTVYFNNTLTTIGEETYYNAYSYPQPISVLKLPTPSIDNVSFVGDDAEALRPSMELHIKGTYGDNDRFVVYIGDNPEIIKEFTASDVKENDGEYLLTLNYDEYISYFTAGAQNDVKVTVASSENIPSSMNSVKVYFNNELLSISQGEDEYALGKQVEISFASEGDISYANGGIILEITFTPRDGEESKEYVLIDSANFASTVVTYDLSSFFLEHMQNGGTLSYKAFVNSYSDGESYILSSNSIESGVYEVLATPIYDETDGTITLTNEGVIIGEKDGENINENASYAVSFTDGQNYVTRIIGADDDYTFEYPDAWVSNENYTISIMAFEEGKISSAVTTLEILLQRLARVENVTLTRDNANLSNLILSWDAVDNANLYIVRAYILNEEEKTYIGAEVETATTQIYLSELFGNNYESLSSFVSAGRDINIEIISSSTETSYHNSQVRLVKTTLLGTDANGLDSGDMNITANGELYFSTTPMQKYLYSIVSVDGFTTYLPWTEVTASSDSVMIDISKVELITSDMNFRVRVSIAGDATTDGVIYNDDTILLQLDSQYIQGSRVFMQSVTPEDVSVNTVDNSKLSITVQSEVVKVFASLSDTFNIDDAVYIEGIYDNFMADAGKYIYNLNMSLVQEQFDLTSDTTIYLYVVQEAIPDEIYYVVSKAKAYNFKALSAASVYDVRKITEGLDADYMHTYIVFKQRSDIPLTGFNIIIEYTNPQNTSEALRFNVMLQIDGTTHVDGVALENSYATLSGDEILIDVYGILEELDTVFDYEDSSLIPFPNKSGEGNYMFYISEVGTLNEEIYFSPYITKFGDLDLNFTKLPEALSVIIDSGNVEWNIDENYLGLMEKFYIFLYDNANTELFNRYETSDTTERTFNGDLFKCSGNEYNISLACVSSDPFVISSSERFVLDTANNIAVVVKNQFNSELTLSAGTLSINWNSGIDWADDDINKSHDIYELLSGIRAGNEVTQDVVSALVTNTFYYPFTFTLRDLVNGNVRLRFRFTSYVDEDKTTIDFRRVADMDARYIFTGDLLGTSDIDRLNAYSEAFASNTTNNTDRELIVNFFNILKYSTGGIGNYKNVFDFVFEAIQEGSYEIEYCLLGNSSTLTSEWKVLASGDNQDFFVNPTVHVEAGLDDVMVNGEKDIVSAYYIKIHRSQIYMQDGTKQDATTYFMQISGQSQAMSEKYGIEISTLDGGTSWNAKLAGNDGASFSVEKVDEDDDGEYDYLKLYLNISVDENGTKGYNAVLSQYPDVFAKGAYYFEVFAQGNNYSISSKSTLFTLTLYSACEDFKVTNGEFSWTAFRSLPTTIIYKAVSSRNSASATVYPQENSVSYFSLDNLADGEYEYIKFATLGSIIGNQINIDSEVYIVENVYKLSSPTVTTELNAFALQDNNRNVYTNIYSDDRSIKYEVNNNANTQNTSFIFTAQSYDANISKSIYEAGTTNYTASADDPDYIYKLTELSADEFSFTSLGSTASYSAVRDGIELNVYNLMIANQGTSLTMTAIKSNMVNAGGKMLPSVPTASVEDGMLSWAPMSFDSAELGLGNGAIVYEVGVQFYEITNTALGTTTSNIGTEIVAYTTDTTFDLSYIEDAFPELINGRAEYVKVTLQALLLNVVENEPIGRNYITLVDGKYAYGDNITYTSLEPTEDVMPYILRSNGYVIEGLSLADSVSSLQVLDGHLTWQYETESDVTFIVTDEEGNVIDGDISTTDNIHYIFVENGGEIDAGLNTLNVYVVLDRANTLKSRKVALEVYKLASVEEAVDENGDYIVESIMIDIGDEVISGEVLDFSNYFNKNSSTYTVNLKIDGEIDFNLTKENSRVLILSSQNDYDSINSALPSAFDGYSEVLVVPNTLDVIITAVSVDEVHNNVLSSDEFNLVLNRPIADYVIIWNSDTQTFSWSSPTQVEDENTLFILDVTYMYMSSGRVVEENRRYEIAYADGSIVKEFTPTIIGDVRFSLTIKYGKEGLQSQRMTYAGSVNFNLFNSGAGTAENPYIITNNQQFTNIKSRMSKLSYLNSYISDSEEVTDDSTRYSFRLDADILNLTFDGILFSGEFAGNLDGGTHTISYTSNALSTNNLTSSQTASVGQITSLNTGDNGISFRKGLALFERVSGNISNLIINATYSSSSVLRDNTLFAGLTIENSASAIISDVAISGMTSTVAVQNVTEAQTVAVYAGLVAFNNGRILRGSVTGDIEISDRNTTGVQNIFVGGISYTSLGIIENSTLSGNITLDLENTGGGRHQVAGIAVTTTGTFQNNTIGNNSKVTANGVSGNSHTVYIAGFAVYARGTVSGNTPVTDCTVVNNITGATRNDYICNTGVTGG